jgi:hypothetical protein
LREGVGDLERLQRRAPFGQFLIVSVKLPLVGHVARAGVAEPLLAYAPQVALDEPKTVKATLIQPTQPRMPAEVRCAW